MSREFLDYIDDIIEAMDDALRFIENVEYEDFIKDKRNVYAVIRAIEIIGEAVKNIPNKIKEDYPKIPWKEMAGMRDKLIHEYFGVDVGKIWNTLKKDIPNLKPLFNEILKDFNS